MFYLADKTEHLSLGHSLSDSCKGLIQRHKEEAGYTSSRSIKRLLFFFFFNIFIGI